MASVKVTFTLDEETIGRLALLSKETRQPKSAVVRDAIERRFAERGRMSAERQAYLLSLIEKWKKEPPLRTESQIEAEVRGIRRARRAGGSTGFLRGKE
jgi:predicted transcriptional regulator